MLHLHLHVGGVLVGALLVILLFVLARRSWV